MRGTDAAARQRQQGIEGCHEATVYPPLRFAAIEAGVYRSAYPRHHNLPFLTTLGLRTLIALTPEPPDSNLTGFAATHGIKIHHLTTAPRHDALPITHDHIHSVLHLILNTRNHPALIFSLKGTVATGLAVIGIRLICCWSYQSALVEYTRFVREEDAPGPAQEEFVKSMRDIEGLRSLPTENLPDWALRSWNGFPEHPIFRNLEFPLCNDGSQRDGTGTAIVDNNGENVLSAER